MWREAMKNLGANNAATRKKVVDDIGVIKNVVWMQCTDVSLFVERSYVADSTSVWSPVILVTAHHV